MLVKFSLYMPCRHMWHGDTASLILNPGKNGDKWWALCPGHFTLTESPHYWLKRRIGGSLSQSKCCREEKDLLPLPKNVDNPACSLVTTPIKLSLKIQIVFRVTAPYRLVGVYQCSTGTESSSVGYHEDRGNMFIWNFGSHLPDYMMALSRSQ